MKKLLLTMTTVAALAAMPSLASADDAAANAAGGAAVGAGVGFAVGGPIGAAVGAGVGGTVGAGSARDRGDVVIEHDRAPVRERNCTRDSAGNSVCEEIRR